MMEYSSGYEFNESERLFERIVAEKHPHSHPAFPPDLSHDSDEDDKDSLSTPSFLLSPKQNFNTFSRRKSVPHKSPSVVQDALQASLFDKSVVFQLDPYHDDVNRTSKIISGQSLLSALRRKVAHARRKPPMLSPPNRKRAVSMIEIPRSHHRRASDSSASSSNSTKSDSYEPQQWNGPMEVEEDQVKRAKKTNCRPSSHSSGRPSRVKGPCQACQEASDGCMRKAFNWPFPSSQIFNDKGRPFVYLCNKCGLRYNKSGGCVCRHCRWVFCKEEKRKAFQHIDAMRRRRPGGQVDPNEDIENFVCSPKYWACGRPWKVGWVLNNLDEEDEEILQQFS